MTGRSRPERGAGLQMQQQAMVQLVVAGVLMALLCAGTAFVYVVGIGPRSARHVPPLLAGFMRAGADADALAGHSLYSDAGLRAVPLATVEELYAQRELFEGFDYVRVVSFQTAPPAGPAAPDTATVVATVYYRVGPPGRIDARLELDPRGWRLREISVVRASP